MELLLFIGVCIAVSVSPGPAVLYIVTRTLDQGVAAGLASMAGITIGGLVHVLLAAFGVAAAAAAWPLSLIAVQLLGGVYLVWLGVQRARASRSYGRSAADLPPEPLAVLFRQGVTVNLTNPKTILFLLAFLPQFVDPGAGSLTAQMLRYGLTFVVVATVTDSAYVLTAGVLRQRIIGSRLAGRSGYAAGAIYAVLGILGCIDALSQLSELRP